MAVSTWHREAKGTSTHGVNTQIRFACADYIFRVFFRKTVETNNTGLLLADF